jgi:hypothetical protein
MSSVCLYCGQKVRPLPVRVGSGQYRTGWIGENYRLECVKGEPTEPHSIAPIQGDPRQPLASSVSDYQAWLDQTYPLDQWATVETITEALDLDQLSPEWPSD